MHMDLINIAAIFKYTCLIFLKVYLSNYDEVNYRKN